MYSRTARYYDKLYAFKDYEAASRKLAALIKARRPGAESLLDVACGTGLHIEHLQRQFEVEGLDLDPALLDVAKERCPGIPFHQADMTSFALGRRFDVVTCLFSSIGYVQTVDRLDMAVLAMRRHLNPGGLLIVEPWFAPDSYWEGKLTGNYFDEPDLKISWIYVNARDGDVSVMDIHYTVGTPEGVEQFREVHRVGLFTDEQYAGAFAKAGLRVDYDPEGLFGRGMYIGQLDE